MKKYIAAIDFEAIGFKFFRVRANSLEEAYKKLMSGTDLEFLEEDFEVTNYKEPSIECISEEK